MSLHFLPLHCRFSSLHFLEDSFIRIPFPFRSRCPVPFTFCPCIFLHLGFSPLPSSFSCNSFDFHFVHFQSLLFPCISPLAHCFASPTCTTSSASSRMMLAMLGVLSSFRHPPKILVFSRCGEMLQKSPKPIRESFAPYKGGPAQNVCACSAHGRRHGARSLIPEGKPAARSRPVAGLWPAARSRPVAGFTR